MYLEHFGLTEAPFRITPNTGFFFAGANRGATLEALLYAIIHDEGIVKVSGEVGSGKTMLCRVLIEKLPEHVDTIYLGNPSLSREDMLFAIAGEMQLEIPQDSRISQVLRTLQEHLIQRYAAGRRVVVLVDEAHAMPLDSLEEIRLLSNLESSHHKLLQIVLFGQPELNEILAQKNMRQLKERITHNFSLEPLVRTDIAEYIDFRLRTAGYRGASLFPATAIQLINQASRGLTRRINILADKSLLAAFAGNSHNITPAIVQAAIKDSEFSSFFGKKKWGYVALAAGLTLVAVTTAISQRRDGTPPSPGNKQPPTLSQAQPEPATEPAPSPAPNVNLAQPLVAPPAWMAELKPLTLARIEASRPWLSETDDQRWFIQLTAADANRADYLEAFVLQASRHLKLEELHVYVSKIKERHRIGVIYGDFATRQEVLASIAQLPGELRALKPYPRQVKRLR